MESEETLRRTVLKVAGNVLSFRVDYGDAEILVRDIFSPDIDQVKDVRVRFQKVPGTFGEFNQRFDDLIWRSLSEIMELEIRKLTELPDRLLWWKRRGHPVSRLISAPTVLDIEKLPGFHDLPKALQSQEAAAFRLAGCIKSIKLPEPRQHVRQPGAVIEEIPYWSD